MTLHDNVFPALGVVMRKLTMSFVDKTLEYRLKTIYSWLGKYESIALIEIKPALGRCLYLPQSTPVVWFLISLLVWALVALLVWRVLKRMHFRSQGLTTIRTRFYRKVRCM